jgi:hypothetical protein
METDYDPEIPRDESFWSCWFGQYSAFLAFARRQKGKRTKVALVRYEDLALSPVRTKQSFLDWVGVADTEDVDTSYHTTVEKIAQGINPTEDWKAHQVNEVHDQSVGRWRMAAGETAAMLQSYHSYPEAEQFG